MKFRLHLYEVHYGVKNTTEVKPHLHVMLNRTWSVQNEAPQNVQNLMHQINLQRLSIKPGEPGAGEGIKAVVRSLTDGTNYLAEVCGV